MCNKANVPSVTLQTAVLLQVKEFAEKSQPFSAHDVTVNIRNKTSQGDLEIPEVEVQGASFRFDIPHAKVKGIFDELWRTGVFDPILTLNRNFNGTYFEYTPTLTSQPAPVTAFATNANNVGQNWGATSPAPTATVKPTVQTTGTAAASAVPDSVVRERIKTYLENCKNRCFRPTLKQVQSAIKRDVSTGWSCEKIQDYIEGLGFTVVPDPDYVSASQVVL